MNYDYEIFISYRRDPDFPTAELLFRELEKRGFEGKVFLDVHKDEPGEFPDRLRNAVKASKHFILILSPKSLERCTQPGDWVAEEISIALEHKKNIIPVTTYRNFDFPEDLPGQLSVLKTYQRIELNFDFFDASIDKLISFIDPSLKDNINAKKDQSASSIQWDKIKPQFILMAISALALLLFFTGRKVAEIQVGDKEKYVTGKIASSMTPEIINGQLYFRAEYKGKHLTYNIANDEIGLNHADVTDKVKQFSSAEIMLGSVFIANAGMWTYFKSLPSKLNFFKSRNKEAIITTAAVVVAVSAYFLGRYTVEKELKNPLDSGNIDLLKRNTSTLRRCLFDRYMNICTNNNFNDFDIGAIPSAHFK